VNPYDILQVSPVADAQVIRAAYRSLIQRHHPDHHPGNAEIAELAARITQAYELLADPKRRAEYDASLKANALLSRNAASPLKKNQTRISRTHAVSKLKSQRLTWALGFAALLGCIAIVWVLAQNFSMRSFSQPPAEQLADIRLKIEGIQINEVERLKLFARKQDLLRQHPELLLADRALRVNNLADRSLALLAEPLSLEMAAAAGSNLPSIRLIIPEITLVLGSFDVSSLQGHVQRHRQRIVAELMQRLASQSAVSMLNPDSEAKLKRMIKESVTMSLDIRAADIYPSTYFESPGRHGVVDVILPQSFGVLK
jgi:DnaJ domain